MEPVAAIMYCNILNNDINLYPCGVVVSSWAHWLAASPDRKIYDPSKKPTFELLEIKCPNKNSVLEVPYLKMVDGHLQLNRRHKYYTKVLTQLAVTGLDWCDFFVWTENDFHLETIVFDRDQWQDMKNKVDKFFFDYYL